MVQRWNTVWKALTETSARTERSCYGLYQIRLVQGVSVPVSIGTLGGVDSEGIIYVGQAHNLAERLSQWIKGPHSGGETFHLMTFSQPFQSRLKGRSLEYRVRYIEDIWEDRPELKDFPDFADALAVLLLNKAEIQALAEYFRTFAELPPCNTRFEDKWGGFYEAVAGP